MNPRQFLGRAVAHADNERPAAIASSGPIPDFDTVRSDFPRAKTAAYFDNASSHPLSAHSATALHRYIDWVTADHWIFNPNSTHRSCDAKKIADAVIDYYY